MTATNTRDEILTRLLAEIPSTFDKSVGSFFYDSLAAAALEFERAYAQNELNLNESFISTASEDYIEYATADNGLTRNQAVKATGHVLLTGVEGSTINIGDLVASELLVYAATESKTIAVGDTTVLCEVAANDAGIAGNINANMITLFPVTLAGFTAVNNPFGQDTASPDTEFDNGADIEELEAYRTRCLEYIADEKTSGNKAHYKAWAREVDGVGDARVIPLAYGPGTVQVVVCDTSYAAASSQLLIDVKNYIDPVSGTGEGKAPVGASVTVASAEEKAIQIKTTLRLQEGTDTDAMTTRIINAIELYFQTIALTDTKVSFGEIGNIIFDDVNVLDYEELLLRKTSSGVWTATSIEMLDTELPTITGSGFLFSVV